jgi:hypothetical protein
MPLSPVCKPFPVGRTSCHASTVMIVLALALELGMSVAALAAPRSKFSDWGSINDKRYGFSIAYPADVLFPIDTPTGVEGRVLQSADGKAKLLVATFPNEQKMSLEAYRQFLIDGNYAGTKLDYTPVKSRWFVLSGERGDFTFYERVTFSCGGQLINSWAMIYPTNEKRAYDRVVEAVARTYTPGAGPDGNCRIGPDAGADEPRAQAGPPPE